MATQALATKPDKGTGIDPQLEALKRRAEKLRSDRGTLNAHLDEVREVIAPHAGRFTGKDTPGEKKMSNIFDSTGVVANDLCASSLYTMATNPSSQWFSLRMVNDEWQDDDETKEWLSATEKKIYAKMYAPGTNLSTALHEFYLQLVAFGTAMIFVGRTKKGGLLFQCRSLSECYIAENVDGVVDTLFRYFPWTVRQCVDEWGLDGVSDKTRDMYQKGRYDEQVEILHAVYPRAYTGKKGRMNMPWASCYMELAACHRLEESGFKSFPFICARWEKSAGEIYGRSPGMKALPDVKQLQVMMAETVKILQKMANPPRYLRDDGVLGQQRNVPGGINYWRGNPHEGVMLEPTTDKLPLTLEEMDNLRNRIRTTFLNDTLQIHDDREMTLGEARMRRTERLRLQGPNIGRLDSELAAPLIDHVFEMLAETGDLPIAPEHIEEEQVTVEFVSPLANAQKQEQLGGLISFADYMAPFGEAGLMAAQRKLNMDRIIDGLWDTLNIDPEWLNTDEELEAIDQAAQQEKQAAMAEPMANAANAGTGAVKNLADAQAGGGIDMNALTQLMAKGAMQGGGQMARAA